VRKKVELGFFFSGNRGKRRGRMECKGFCGVLERGFSGKVERGGEVVRFLGDGGNWREGNFGGNFSGGSSSGFSCECASNCTE
jgi:hypothetical protein